MIKQHLSRSQRLQKEREMIARAEITLTCILFFLVCFLPKQILLFIFCFVGLTLSAAWLYLKYFDTDAILARHEPAEQSSRPEPIAKEEPKPVTVRQPGPEVVKEKGITYHEPITNTFYFDGWKEDK